MCNFIGLDGIVAMAICKFQPKVWVPLSNTSSLYLDFKCVKKYINKKGCPQTEEKQLGEYFSINKIIWSHN